MCPNHFLLIKIRVCFYNFLVLPLKIPLYLFLPSFILSPGRRAILARIKAPLCAFSSRPLLRLPEFCFFGYFFCPIILFQIPLLSSYKKSQVWKRLRFVIQKILLSCYLLPVTSLSFKISRMNRFRAVTCKYLPPIRFLIPYNPIITISLNTTPQI